MPSTHTMRSRRGPSEAPWPRPAEAPRSLAALLASVCLHAILVLAASVGWARTVPLVMPPAFAIRERWVETEVLDGDESADRSTQAQASDSVDPGLEDRAQGPLAGDPTATPILPPAPPKHPSPPRGKPAAAGGDAASTASAGPAPKAAPPSEPRASGSGTEHAGDPASGNAAPGRGPNDLGVGEGGGFKRSRDPDLADRFTHDLPSFAQALAAWRDAPLGDTGEVQFVLAIDAAGRITLAGREAVERSEGKRAPLGESIRRTIDGLYATFSLTEGQAGPGKLRLRARARVSDLPPPAQPRERVEVGSAQLERGRARAYFTLEGGRHVEFEVELLAVEREPAPPLPL